METTSNNRYPSGRNNNRGFGFALLLILIGTVYILFNVGIIPMLYKPLIISWQMLLITLGVYSLFKRHYWSGGILVAIGAIFIYPILFSVFPGYFPEINMDFKTYWPLILIIIGLILIISRYIPHKRRYSNYRYNYNRHKHHRSSESIEHESDFLKKDMMFGSCEQIVLSNDFKGGDVNVMFGEIVVDLRKSKLAEGINCLEVNTGFGNSVIYIPKEWDIEIQSSTLMGTFDDRRTNKSENIEKTSAKLIIKSSCMFGTGEIRN